MIHGRRPTFFPFVVEVPDNEHPRPFPPLCARRRGNDPGSEHRLRGRHGKSLPGQLGPDHPRRWCRLARRGQRRGPALGQHPLGRRQRRAHRRRKTRRRQARGHATGAGPAQASQQARPDHNHRNHHGDRRRRQAQLSDGKEARRRFADRQGDLQRQANPAGPGCAGLVPRSSSASRSRCSTAKTSTDGSSSIPTRQTAGASRTAC